MSETIELPEEHKSESDDIKDLTNQYRNNMWVDSILLNYTEEMEVTIPAPDDIPGTKDTRVMRRISMGLTVKSDNRAPAKVLHNAASSSLNYLFELEKEKWLNEYVMKEESARIRDKVIKSREKSKEEKNDKK